MILSIPLFSQNIIRGKVFTRENIPLSSVNIYFDGTTISTISDDNGNFSIKYEPNANSILVISSMGYKTEYLTEFDASKPLKIQLDVSQTMLKEVVITKNELFTREEKLGLFREFFLGKTMNAKSTIIKNEEDIRFRYDKESFTLYATAEKPLIIINNALGYKIDFELIFFEIKFNRLSIYSKDVKKNFYGGVSRFEEIANSDEIIQKREEAYQGSQIHFFRNFAKNEWGTKKFRLIKDNRSVDPDQHFKLTNEGDYVKVEVISKQNDKNSKHAAFYDVLFDRREQSRINFFTDSFYIYKYGNNSNLDGILFSGKIAEKRVADMLPLNFNID